MLVDQAKAKRVLKSKKFASQTGGLARLLPRGENKGAQATDSSLVTRQLKLDGVVQHSVAPSEQATEALEQHRYCAATQRGAPGSEGRLLPWVVQACRARTASGPRSEAGQLQGQTSLQTAASDVI